MSGFGVFRRLRFFRRGRQEHMEQTEGSTVRPSSEDPEEIERAAQRRRLAQMLEARADWHDEAARIVDRRLALARDAASWNVATFGTLTLASAAAVATLVLTGFTWWFLLPAVLGVITLWLTVQAVRRLRVPTS